MMKPEITPPEQIYPTDEQFIAKEQAGESHRRSYRLE